jgi:hypothetical protein
LGSLHRFQECREFQKQLTDSYCFRRPHCAAALPASALRLLMLLEYPAVAVAALCASSLQIRFSATGTPHFMLKPSTEKIQTSKSFMCPIPAAMYHDPLRRHDLNSLTIAGGRLKLPRILPEQAEVKNT